MIKRKNQWQIHDIYSGQHRNFNIRTRKSFWQRHSRLFGGAFKGGLTVMISVLIIYGVVQAGSLTPLASPAATSYTLSDIYTRLTTNATSTEANHAFSPVASPAGTLYTLSQVYNAIPTIDATKVLLGTTYLGIAGAYNASNLDASTVKSGTAFGVSLTGDYPSATYPLPGDTAATDATAAAICNGNEAWTKAGSLLTGTLSVTADSISVGNTYCGTAGTLLANLFNGTDTGGTFPGGSQADGGVDDYNKGGQRPSDSYSKEWTACNLVNNYCGTGNAGAAAKDNSTGLIWSKPCNGLGCSSFSDASPLTYSWDSSATNNNKRTASQLCSDHPGWFLPHQKQLMQAYIDGAYGNLEASGVSRYYWSATTQSNDTAYAWLAGLSNGFTSYNTKTYSYYVRCVRSAP